MVTVSVHGHGAVIGLTAPADLIADAARAFAPTLAVEPVDPSPHATVVVDTDAPAITSPSLGVTTASDPQELVRLIASVTQLELAAHARPEVFVHAGVVAHRGLGIVVPGASRAGKTTLVRALVEAGADYYSDEYAVLDLNGNVAPFAKPLSIRVEGGRSKLLDPRVLGTVGTDLVPVAVVAALVHRPGAVWAPSFERGATTALPLVENTVPARERQTDTLDSAVAVARRAVLVRGERGEAGAAADALLELLELIEQGDVST